METNLINAINSIVSQLKQNMADDLKAFLGFDACIDNIVRVIRNKNKGKGSEFFESSRDFGRFLIDHENKSCGVELQTNLIQPGGNMFITANALGKLGIKVDCVGTFGIPDILPSFYSISENCNLHSIGDTIVATAVEFNNSKVILFDPGPYNLLDWNSIKNTLGFEKLHHLLAGKQLISFLNWSEIENSMDIWEGILNEVIPEISQGGNKPLFFTDLSDCSRKKKEEFEHLRQLLYRFRKIFKVILSLNAKEADLLAQGLNMRTSIDDEEFLANLLKTVNADLVVIHRTHDAVAHDGNRFEKCDTFRCKEPVILTGGGDNFNAGFCYSLMHEFTLFQSLIIGNAVAGIYIRTGTSPCTEDLIGFLTEQLHLLLND